MRIEPIGSRLLVKVLSESDKTASGLYIPSMALDNTPWLRGEVVAAGPGSHTAEGKFVPAACTTGDVIIFFRSGDGRQVVVPDPANENEELLLIQEGSVCAKIHDLPTDAPSKLVNVDGVAVSSSPIKVVTL